MLNDILDGKLVSIDADEPFKFDVFADDQENQKRYESIGKLVDNVVYELLENECHLQRVTIPVGLFYTIKMNLSVLWQVDFKKNEDTSFIFTSNNLSTADYLMVIIHGAGVVRAGQWSRK